MTANDYTWTSPSEVTAPHGSVLVMPRVKSQPWDKGEKKIVHILLAVTKEHTSDILKEGTEMRI